MGPALFVRFQASVPNARGYFPGVFALANGLGRSGRLVDAERRFWQDGNDWYEANLTDPSKVDPSVYDRSLNPGATAWFTEGRGQFAVVIRVRDPVRVEQGGRVGVGGMDAPGLQQQDRSRGVLAEAGREDRAG